MAGEKPTIPIDQIETDAIYALKQCRQYHDADRAGDALERIVERLEQAKSSTPDSADASDRLLAEPPGDFIEFNPESFE